MITRLVNLEGVDCCGKTTLSKLLATRLNEMWIPAMPNDQPSGWQASHEPTFSSEIADKLNFDSLDEWQREFYFMKDRINHQALLNSANVVLDRYILSGLAYAQTFSPKVVPMMLSVYSMIKEFKRPDVVVFLDIEPEDAMKFNELKKGTSDYSERMSINSLQTIRDNYKLHFQALEDWEVPLITVKPIIGDVIGTLANIEDKINYLI
jgi:thymidylate kinase